MYYGLETRLANIGFILFFPIFFFFHFAIAWLNLPLHIGLFGETALLIVILFPTLFFPAVFRVMQGSSLISIIFFLLLGYCALWTLGGMALIPTDEIPEGAIPQLASLIALWTALFFTGLFVNVDSTVMRWLVSISLLGMAGIVAHFIDPHYFVMNPNWLFQNHSVTSYQGFTRSAMITAIALISAMRNITWRLVLSSLCIFLVFTLGARSELYGLIFVIAAFESFRALRKPLAILPVMLVVLIVMGTLIGNFDTISSSRQFNVLDLSQDTSWTLRESETSFAMRQISDSPILGEFAGHFDAGSAGTYSHTVLSSWVSFGLVGFLLYIVISIISLWKTIKAGCREIMSTRWRFAFYMNVSSFIMILGAKPVFWPIIALAWGATVNAAYSDRFDAIASHVKPIAAAKGKRTSSSLT